MRRIAWLLMLLFAFVIPWEYSLDLGAPLGNIARLTGLLVLVVAVPAVFASGRLRDPGCVQWLVLALYLWLCCTYFWSIEPQTTLQKLRGFFQTMMIVWLIWEFAESAGNLRALLRVIVAGSWVLAILTVIDFASAHAAAAAQIRFAAAGQDPNDVARFLNLCFPLAALLFTSERRWAGRLLAGGYLPLGLLAVLLTASRGGFLAALVSLAGSAVLLAYGRPGLARAGALALPPLLVLLWLTVPRATLARLGTIPEQLERGSLNQRWNIWEAGWHAFAHAPIAGTGAGTFITAAGTASFDTAHNTALSLAVGGGLCALFLAVAIVAAAAWSIAQTHGSLRGALLTALLALLTASLVATVEESRSTWLLIGVMALAGRLAAEKPEEMEAVFPRATHFQQSPHRFHAQ
ncbi:MAG: O-antigen ligase family protein [Terracidiphilus sp.]